MRTVCFREGSRFCLPPAASKNPVPRCEGHPKAFQKYLEYARNLGFKAQFGGGGNSNMTTQTVRREGFFMERSKIIKCTNWLVVAVKHFCDFHPDPWGDDPIWLLHIFQMGGSTTNQFGDERNGRSGMMMWTYSFCDLGEFEECGTDLGVRKGRCGMLACWLEGFWICVALFWRRNVDRTPLSRGIQLMTIFVGCIPTKNFNWGTMLVTLGELKGPDPPCFAAGNRGNLSGNGRP